MVACRLLVAALLASCATAAALAAAQPARQADSVANMVGVNTHISYPGTAYDTGYDAIVKPRLLELGVRHIRDNPGQPLEQWVRDRHVDLARAGVRLLLINYPDRGLDYAKRLIAQGGTTSVVEAVEPMNERDIPQRWFGCTPNWQPCLRSYIEGIRQAFKDDPMTAALTFLGPSFANTRDSARSLAGIWPGSRAFMDRGNLHDYGGLWPESPQGAGWGIGVADAVARYQALSGTDAMWVTENGYKVSGAVDGHPSVRGPRAGLRACGPRLRRRRRPGGRDQMLFQKRDGTYLLAIWQGVNSAAGTSDATRRDVEPAARPVTLTLPRPFARARVFQPSFRAAPVRTVSNAGSLGLAVPDHVVVVELTP